MLGVGGEVGKGRVNLYVRQCHFEHLHEYRGGYISAMTPEIAVILLPFSQHRESAGCFLRQSV